MVSKAVMRPVDAPPQGPKGKPVRAVRKTLPRRPVGATVPAPPPGYVWDNWPVSLGSAGTHLGRFSLEAPRLGPPDSRHENARIALFLPNKEGDFAKFCDVVTKAPAWSGSALNLTELGRNGDLDRLATRSFCAADPTENFDATALESFRDTAIVLPYTSRARLGAPLLRSLWGHIAPQTISLCYKRAGSMAFEVHGEVLNPFRSTSENMRYYKTNDSRFVISAWRDPFIFFENDQYHMLFSARYSRAFFEQMPNDMMAAHTTSWTRHAISDYHEDINSTIGYATSKNLKAWDLKKPLFLPANGAQFELPTCTRVGDSHVLTAAVCDGCVTSQDADLAQSLFGPRRQRLAAFKTDAPLSEFGRPDVWTALNDRINGDTHPLKKSYGLTFREVGEKVFATAFDDRAFTFTPMIEMSRQAFPFNIPSEHEQCWNLLS